MIKKLLIIALACFSISAHAGKEVKILDEHFNRIGRLGPRAEVFSLYGITFMVHAKITGIRSTLTKLHLGLSLLQLLTDIPLPEFRDIQADVFILEAKLNDFQLKVFETQSLGILCISSITSSSTERIGYAAIRKEIKMFKDDVYSSIEELVELYEESNRLHSKISNLLPKKT